MPEDDDDALDALATPSEIATHFGVTRKVVGNWVARSHYNGFPACRDVVEAGAGKGRRMTKVWRLGSVVEWRANYRPVQGAAAHRRNRDGSAED